MIMNITGGVCHSPTPNGRRLNRHYRQRELAYTFVSPERLIDDFLAEVVLERGRS
jgi:hypothetical protein